MSERLLFDVPGPRARARIRVLSVLSALVILALVAAAVAQFGAHGQLAADVWQPFAQRPILIFLGKALLQTLKATAVAGVLALPFGALLALARLSRTQIIRLPAAAFVDVFRSVPLLLLLFFFLLALPRFGINVPIFWKLVVPIIIVNAAVLAEIFRAGVLALDRGQSEASYAIGMSYWQTMRIVVIPQAVRRLTPALVTQIVALLKDTTLGYVVSFPELLQSAKVLGNFPPQKSIQAYLVVAVIFVVINVALSQLAHALERRQGRRRARPADAALGAGTSLA